MNVRVLLLALTVTPTLLAAGPAPTPQPLSDASLQGASSLVLPSIALVLQNVSGELFDSRDHTTHGPYIGTYAGTGFFVSADGYLVTAAHVAAPTPDMIKDELVDFDIDQTFKCDIHTAADRCQGVENQHHDEFLAATSVVNPNIDIRVLTQDMEPSSDGLSATVAASIPTSEKDIAILKIDGRNEPVALLADAGKVVVGSPLAVIGYPVSGQAQGATLVPTITSGRVVDKRHGDVLGAIAVNADLVEVDAHTEHGNSGGPGLGLDGGVIGIVSFGDTQNRNFLISASEVVALLQTTPARNQLGAVDAAYRQGLQAYQSGDYSGARQRFDQCNQLDPGQIYCRDDALNAAAGGVTSNAQASLHNDAIPTWAERGLWVLLGALLGGGLVAIGARRRRTPAVVPPFATAFSPGNPAMPWGGFNPGYGMAQPGFGAAMASMPMSVQPFGAAGRSGVAYGGGLAPAPSGANPYSARLFPAAVPAPPPVEIPPYPTFRGSGSLAADDALPGVALGPPPVPVATANAHSARWSDPTGIPIPQRQSTAVAGVPFQEPAVRAHVAPAATMPI